MSFVSELRSGWASFLKGVDPWRPLLSKRAHLVLGTVGLGCWGAAAILASRSPARFWSSKEVIGLSLVGAITAALSILGISVKKPFFMSYQIIPNNEDPDKTFCTPLKANSVFKEVQGRFSYPPSTDQEVHWTAYLRDQLFLGPSFKSPSLKKETTITLITEIYPLTFGKSCPESQLFNLNLEHPPDTSLSYENFITFYDRAYTAFYQIKKNSKSQKVIIHTRPTSMPKNLERKDRHFFMLIERLAACAAKIDEFHYYRIRSCHISKMDKMFTDLTGRNPEASPQLLLEKLFASYQHYYLTQ